MNTDTPQLLTLKEAGAILRAEKSKVYGLIGAGKIPAVKLGRRTYIPANELKAFIDNLPRVKRFA